MDTIEIKFEGDLLNSEKACLLEDIENFMIENQKTGFASFHPEGSLKIEVESSGDSTVITGVKRFAICELFLALMRCEKNPGFGIFISVGDDCFVRAVSSDGAILREIKIKDDSDFLAFVSAGKELLKS